MILAFAMLAVTGAAFAGDARPSMPYFGTATLDDEVITIQLRSTADGKPADGTLTYKRGDRSYDNVLRHLGGLRDGEAKPVRPWKD
jgi:hypothetical protein